MSVRLTALACLLVLAGATPALGATALEDTSVSPDVPASLASFLIRPADLLAESPGDSPDLYDEEREHDAHVLGGRAHGGRQREVE